MRVIIVLLVAMVMLGCKQQPAPEAVRVEPKAVPSEATPSSPAPSDTAADAESMGESDVDNAIRYAESCVKIGRNNLRQGDLDRALQWFTEAIEAKRDHQPAWHGKANTLSRMKRHAEAQAAYDSCLALRPNDATILWHRACDYAASGKKNPAFENLRRAVALDVSIKGQVQADSCFQQFRQDDAFLAIVR